jgi:ketosteroid isomerase-like protein
MAIHDDFRAALEAKDHAGMVATIAPHAKLHSPVAFKPFDGRDQIAGLFTALLEVFEDFRYTDEFESPDGADAVLIFRARIGDKEVEGLDLIRPGADGLIEDFTVMVRPLSAAIALAEAVGPRLAAAGVVK